MNCPTPQAWHEVPSKVFEFWYFPLGQASQATVGEEATVTLIAICE